MGTRGVRVTRRISIASLLVPFVLALSLISVDSATALQTTYSTRTVGADRYATSALTALDAYPSGAPSAVIVQLGWPGSSVVRCC